MAEKEPFTLPGGFAASEPEAFSLKEVDSFLDNDPDSIVDADEAEEKRKLEAAKKKEEAEKLKSKKQPPIKKDEDDDEDDEEEVKQPKELTQEEIADRLFGPKDGDEEAANEDEDEDAEDNTSKDKSKKEPSLYGSLAKSLSDMGIFTPDEDENGIDVPYEINDALQFAARWGFEVNKQASNVIGSYLNRFGPEYGEMFDAVYEKGVPPEEYINRRARIEGFKDLDISSEDNQERVIRQLYKLEGRSNEYIEAKLTKLKERGDLEDEAKESHEVLIAKEEKNLQDLALQKQAENKRKEQITKQYVDNVKQILSNKLKEKDFNGIPVDRKLAEKTLEYATATKWETPTGQKLTEFDVDILDLNRPENHERKVHLAMLMQMIKTDPNLSKIQKKAISNETNAIFGDLERMHGKNKRPKETVNSKKDNISTDF